MDLYTCRTSRFGFSSFRSEPFFFLIYDSSCRWGLRSLLLSGRAFFTLEPKAAVRGLLYSVRVVIALSLTERGRGRRAEQVDGQIVCYEMMAGG